MGYIQPVPRRSRSRKMLAIRQDKSCPSGQLYWTCTTTPTHFAGCCVGNPCWNEGICPDSQSSTKKTATTKTTNTPTPTPTPTTTAATAANDKTVTLTQTANGSLTTITEAATQSYSSATASATASAGASTTTSSSGSSNSALPIGVIVGVVALVALLIGAFFFIRKRKQKQARGAPLPVEDPQSPTRNSGFFQSLKKRLPVGPGTSPPLRSPPPVYEEQETNGQWPGHAELPAAVPMRALASVPMEMPTEEHARLQGGAGGAGGAGGGSTANGDGLGISELPAQVPSRNEERSRSVLSSMRYESVDNGDGRANRVG